MASILTNTGAMTALQTLRSINKGLAQTQDQISTGKRVATAKDNAASFAVAAVMKSDVAGFKALNESLSVGSATLGVARQGAETTVGLLEELKGRIVSAQASNVDRSKIQADAAQLVSQVESTVSASQFNGLNMLQATATDSDVDILASLNRTDATTVTSENITVSRLSLESAKTSVSKVTDTDGAATAAATVIDMTGGANGDYTDFAAGDTVALKLTNADGQGVTLTVSITQDMIDAAETAELANAGDGAIDLATAIFGELNTAFGALDAETFDTTGITLADAGDGTITIESDDSETSTWEASGVAGGGLAAMSLIDVSTEAGAKAALSAIEGLTQNSVDAAASFGSAQKRVELQQEFTSKISDSLTTGIGAIVDADLEEVSARLQALQVQQQLGVQSLSIANQAPQTILSLFR
jgi:flagellin